MNIILRDLKLRNIVKNTKHFLRSLKALTAKADTKKRITKIKIFVKYPKKFIAYNFLFENVFFQVCFSSMPSMSSVA